jgi:hypothetical protein
MARTSRWRLLTVAELTDLAEAAAAVVADSAAENDDLAAAVVAVDLEVTKGEEDMVAEKGAEAEVLIRLFSTFRVPIIRGFAESSLLLADFR